jgi:N-methylhydantoinase A
MTTELLGVDIGGTFTDFVLLRDGKLVVHKLLSTPDDPSRALLQGVRDLNLAGDGEIVHGSTVATNALLERKGARTALITTKGFADVIEIGRQNRPKLYDFYQTKPAPFVPREWRFEVAERLDERGHVLIPLNPSELNPIIEQLIANHLESIAICCLFAFLNPAHEQSIKQYLISNTQSPNPQSQIPTSNCQLLITDYSLPFISLSSDILPEYREYERASTTIINAYVAPVVARYVRNLEAGLEGRRLRIMQSNGGSITAQSATAVAARLALSGPAGGVVGAFTVAQLAGYTHIIGFDMGGTSTDVSLCAGQLQETNEGNIAGFPMRLPMLDIHTVGAGGGSLARVDAGGALRVGPESAGALPGPACYGRGGAQATVTDANLIVGRLAPDKFLGGRMRLDVGAAERVMDTLAQQMNCDRTTAAHGMVRVVNATMERAIRQVSIERGYDPRDFTLVAFGGAGPLHACALAEALAIPRVLAPRYPGVLSALGMLTTDLVKDFSQSVIKEVSALDSQLVGSMYEPLMARARDEMVGEGVTAEQLSCQLSMDMRYVGQSYELTIAYDTLSDTLARFHAAHLQRFNHADERLPVEVVTLRVKAIGRTRKPQFQKASARRPSSVIRQSHVMRDELHVGDTIIGPCVIYQFDATTYIEEGWRGVVDAWENVIMERKS